MIVNLVSQNQETNLRLPRSVGYLILSNPISPNPKSKSLLQFYRKAYTKETTAKIAGTLVG